MKKFLRVLKYLFLGCTTAVALYLTFAMVTSQIIVNQEPKEEQELCIYLSDAAIHLNLIIPVQYLNEEQLQKLQVDSTIQYLAIGWGEENFYLNTPLWSDLTISTTAEALLWNSPSLMHVDFLKKRSKDWHLVFLSEAQLDTLRETIEAQFVLENKEYLPIAGFSYYGSDRFYRAHGSYSCINTCNSWVNDCLKTAELPACYWTPFGHAITSIYDRNE